MKYNMVLVGVGGQGILFSSRILAEAAIREGIKVRTLHHKGMAQRGGSVKAFLRFGEVYAPTVPLGGADLVLSFELAETLNAFKYVNPEGTKVIVANYKVPSLSNLLGREAYPKGLIEEFRGLGFKIIEVEEILRKENLPSVVMNSLLLGVASKVPGFPIKSEALRRAIEERARRYREENLRAFDLGARL